MNTESIPGIAPVALTFPFLEDTHGVLDSISAGASGPAQVEKLLLSRKEVAHLLGISVRSVAYLISSGKLPVRRIGGRVLHEVEAVHKLAAIGVRRITA